ncbi:MAG: DUF488 domain-containing protein [Ferroplasma sp.]
MAVKLKRIYEDRSGEDGIRVLVDGLWPRGISKEKAGIDIWMKELAPSSELRKWYSHDPEKWQQFREKYIHELCGNEKLKELFSLTDKSNVTILISSKDMEISNGEVLLELINNRSIFNQNCGNA